MEILWEKLTFWKKLKKVEYRLQSSPWEDSTWVEITSGKYSGVIFSYGKVSVDTDHSEIPILKFDYNIVSKGACQNLEDNEEFVNTIGDILMDIIINNE